MENKVIFITGSSRGLGADIVKEALRRDYQVAATARHAKDVLKAHPEAGERLLALDLDVTNTEQVRAAVAQTIEAFGRIDALINNAGYANVSSIEHFDDADFRAQMETNFFGVYNVTKAVLPIMRRQNSGHILQVSSIGGRRGGSPGLAAYQSAKFAVAGFSRVLAAEVAPFGIKVTVLEPGAIRTDWAGSSMKVYPIDEAYQSTLGRIVNYRSENQGRESGDPQRGAQIILDLVENDNPPLHLLLGRDALRSGLEEIDDRRKEIEEWKTLTESFSFPENN